MLDNFTIKLLGLWDWVSPITDRYTGVLATA